MRDIWIRPKGKHKKIENVMILRVYLHNHTPSSIKCVMNHGITRNYGVALLVIIIKI